MSGKQSKRLCQSPMVKHTAWHLLAFFSKAFAEIICDPTVQGVLNRQSPTEGNAYQKLSEATKSYFKGQTEIIDREEKLIKEISEKMRVLEYGWAEFRGVIQTKLSASDVLDNQALLNQLVGDWGERLKKTKDIPSAALVQESCSHLCKGKDGNNICGDHFCMDLSDKVIKRKYEIWQEGITTCTCHSKSLPHKITLEPALSFLPGDPQEVMSHCETLAFEGACKGTEENVISEMCKDELCNKIYDEASATSTDETKMLQLSADRHRSEATLSAARTAKTACERFVNPFVAWYEEFKRYEPDRREAKTKYLSAQGQFEAAKSSLQAAQEALDSLIAQLNPEMEDLKKQAEDLKKQIEKTRAELTKLGEQVEQTADLHDKASVVQKAVLNELRSLLLLVLDDIQQPMVTLLQQVQIVRKDTLDKARGASLFDSSVETLYDKCGDFMTSYGKTANSFEDRKNFEPPADDDAAAEWKSVRKEEKPPSILDICARNVSDQQVYKKNAQDLKHLITFRQRGEDGSIGKLVAAVEEYLQEGINKFEKLRPLNDPEDSDMSTLASLAHFAGTYLSAPLASRYLSFWGKDKHLANMLKLVFDLQKSVEKSNNDAKEKLAKHVESLEKVIAELTAKETEVQDMEKKAQDESAKHQKRKNDLENALEAFRNIEKQMRDSKAAVDEGGQAMIVATSKYEKIDQYLSMRTIKTIKE